MLRRTLTPLVLVALLLLPAIVLHAQEPTASEVAAVQAYRQGAFARAVDLYTKALSETADAAHRAQLHVRIAWVEFVLRHESQVDTHLQAALLEDPDLVLIPDFYTQEFLDLVEEARRKVVSVARARPEAPPPDLEATLAAIRQRLDAGTDLEAALADSERLLAVFPDDLRVAPLRAQIMERLGRDPAEMPVGSGLLEPGLSGAAYLARESITDLILSANRLLDDGDVETSLELLREAVSRQPSNVAALELMAEAARRAARWQEAEFALKSALGLQPDSISLRLRLGEVALAMGDAPTARDVFLQLTERYPHSDRAWAALGLLDAKLDNRSRSLAELAVALRENPLLPEVQLAYGELLLAEGRLQESLDAIRAASNLLHSDPQVEARLGQVLLAMGKPEPALQHLRDAAQGGFAQPDVERALVLALIQNGLLAEAERVIERTPPDARQATELLRGLLLLEKDELEAAEGVLTRVAQSRGNDPTVLNLLAAAVYGQERYEEAVAHLRRAHDLDPTNEQVTVNLERARSARDAVRLGQQARLVQPLP